MGFRFTIIDRNDVCAPDGVVIDEPVGWDAITLELKRENAQGWHGFFDLVNDAGASLEFVDDGFAVLKAAYERDGIEANVELIIEYACADDDSYTTIYSGRFVMSQFKYECGDLCIATAGVQALNCLMTFRSRYDQQVDLDSLETFDNPCTVNEGSFSGNAQLISPNLIHFEDVWLLAPDEICISGSDSNDGAYTVTSWDDSFPGVWPLGGGTMVQVEQAIVNEAEKVIDIKWKNCTGSTPLAAYNGLNLPISVPSKELQLETKWLAQEDQDYTYTLENPLPFAYRTALSPFFADVIHEIDATFDGEGTFIDATPLGGGSGAPPDYGGFDATNPPNPAIDFRASIVLTCIGDASLRLNFTYNLNLAGTTGTIIDTFRVFVVRDQNFLPPYTGQTAGPNQWVWDLIADGSNHAFDQTITFPIAQGDKIWIWFDTEAYTTIGGSAFMIQFAEGSYFDLTIASTCEATEARVYMINEVMSRCVEAYTNDCMRVYSDYYGRTDAQPYPSDANGCGGLRSIANGKKIRNAPTADGVTPIKMTVSMKETFDALTAIDNIGMGLEEDPNRPGYNLLRVEPVSYFFNDTVLMTCTSMRKVTREVDPAIIYSLFKTGYAKWETWNNNGLFDLFGNREYRTSLSDLANTLDKTCQWIASDYAIEFTRRLYGGTTSDWKYDDDIFFLCLTSCVTVSASFDSVDNVIEVVGQRLYLAVGSTFTVTGSGLNDGTFTVVSVQQKVVPEKTRITVTEAITTEASVTVSICGIYIVEQGVDSPANILNPDTVMNYKIAPSRNAMRWFKTMLQSYRKFLAAELIFTQGGGNIIGQGEVLNKDGCRIEDQVISEQQNISLADFDSETDNYPLFAAELVKFEYPMSFDEYLTIKANPYGLIGFQCNEGDIEYGWIEDMQFNPYHGIANFTLRPHAEIK